MAATTAVSATAAGSPAREKRARLSAAPGTFPRVRRLSIARSVQLALLGLTIALTAIAGFGVGALYSSRQAYEDRLAHAFEVKAAAGRLLAASVVEEATLRAKRSGSASARTAQAANAYAGSLADTRRKAADDPASVRLIDAAGRAHAQLRPPPGAPAGVPLTAAAGRAQAQLRRPSAPDGAALRARAPITRLSRRQDTRL